MEYRVVFDIAEAGYKSWGMPAFGLIFVAIGIVLVVGLDGRLGTLPWGRNPKPSRPKKVFAWFYLGFSLLWTASVFGSTWMEYSHLMQAREQGSFATAEGPVADFKPMSTEQHTHSTEHFCVSGHCFDYADNVVSAGFNNASVHGGPIHAGLPVRVGYVGGTIVKLEVGK